MTLIKVHYNLDDKIKNASKPKQRDDVSNFLESGEEREIVFIRLDQ